MMWADYLACKEWQAVMHSWPLQPVVLVTTETGGCPLLSALLYCAVSVQQKMRKNPQMRKVKKHSGSNI